MKWNVRGAALLAIVFTAGLFLGFRMGTAKGRATIVYSGAMSDLENRPFLGSKDALVTIVEYTDYECVFCQRYYQNTFKTLMAEYDGKVRYFVRHFPVPSIHPSSVRAAVAASCAEDQGEFWAYHDILFSGGAVLSPDSLGAYASRLGLEQTRFDECFASQEPLQHIQEDLERGVNYGVRGTPAFFINGRVLFGAQPLETFRATVDAALEEMEGSGD
ncbi:MAG: DsbA family protein [Gemmatimonadetes bacterium]|nr:DsbA family protein [Gemmatimonadota bacterium]